MMKRIKTIEETRQEATWQKRDIKRIIKLLDKALLLANQRFGWAQELMDKIDYAINYAKGIKSRIY